MNENINAGEQENKLWWGPYNLQPEAATQHFLTVGSTGSGKTVLINMLLRSVFQGKESLQRRGLIYDPKQEVLPYLYGMGLKDRIKVLHPFDKRSSAWDMAADIESPVAARQLATILVPEKDGSGEGDSFFTSAVRDLLTGVLLTFIHCVPVAGKWTFRDVLLAMLYEPYLRYITGIDRNRHGKPFLMGPRLKQTYLDGDPRTVSNIRASINAKLSLYEPVAAVWQQAMDSNKSFSLNRWKEDGCNDILVLGNDESARAAIDPINAALFKRVVEVVLSRRELTNEEKKNNRNTSWFFLDEVREAGPLDGLSRLLTKGRSKGAAVVLGFQDIDGLRAVYGEEVANELTGQCNILALLQMNNPTTAQWAVDLLGTFMIQKVSFSHNRGEQGPQVGMGFAQEAQTMFQTGQLIYLPKTGVGNGLSGFFRHPYLLPEDELLRSLNWEKDIAGYLPSASQRATEQAFQERHSDEQYLAPWTIEDWERLGLPGEPPSLAKATPKHDESSDEEKKEWLRKEAIHKAFTAMIEVAANRVINGTTTEGNSSPLRNSRLAGEDNKPRL